MQIQTGNFFVLTTKNTYFISIVAIRILLISLVFFQAKISLFSIEPSVNFC